MEYSTAQACGPRGLEATDSIAVQTEVLEEEGFELNTSALLVSEQILADFVAAGLAGN